MTEPALIPALGARAVTSQSRPVSPGSGRDLCICCRTEKIVPSPATRLPPASCRGSHRRGGGR
jgi:hypothetical protein